MLSWLACLVIGSGNRGRCRRGVQCPWLDLTRLMQALASACRKRSSTWQVEGALSPLQCLVLAGRLTPLIPRELLQGFVEGGEAEKLPFSIDQCLCISPIFILTPKGACQSGLGLSWQVCYGAFEDVFLKDPIATSP